MRDGDAKSDDVNANRQYETLSDACVLESIYQRDVHWRVGTSDPGEGKQYQLLIAGGIPTDAGVFSIPEDQSMMCKNINVAEQWAVTIEPKGGSAKSDYGSDDSD